MTRKYTRKGSHSKGFKFLNKTNCDEEAKQYILQGQWDDAIKAYATARTDKNISKQTNDFKKIFNDAVQAGRSNNDKAALQLHCQLIALKPTDRISLRNFALLLKRNGQYQAALKYIGSLTKGKTIEHAMQILMIYFLPHIGELNFTQKALYLGYIVKRLLSVAHGEEKPTDRDSYLYKRMRL